MYAQALAQSDFSMQGVTVVQQDEPCLAAPAVREIPGAQLPGKEYLAACLQGG